MQITGKGQLVSKVKEDGVSKAGKPYTKYTAIIKTEGEYPKELACTVFPNDKNERTIKDLEQIGNGEDVEFTLVLSSREHNGKYFNDFGLWNIKGSMERMSGVITNEEPDNDDDDNNLPF